MVHTGLCPLSRPIADVRRCGIWLATPSSSLRCRGGDIRPVARVRGISGFVAAQRIFSTLSSLAVVGWNGW
jgi:hypothetical protein